LDAPLSADELVRPWRRATIVTALIAAVELVLLVVCAAVLVAKPLARAVRHHAERVAAAPAAKPKPKAIHAAALRRTPPPAKPHHPRAKTKVLVLNGNGRTGAAHAEASRLQSLGYRIAGAADAHRHDYATSVVMYRHGFRPEGVRLARDLHIRVVGPLDGLRPAALDGGQLAVIIGAE
jgi:hypothetical protein